MISSLYILKMNNYKPMSRNTITSNYKQSLFGFRLVITQTGSSRNRQNATKHQHHHYHQHSVHHCFRAGPHLQSTRPGRSPAAILDSEAADSRSRCSSQDICMDNMPAISRAILTCCPVAPWRYLCASTRTPWSLSCCPRSPRRHL